MALPISLQKSMKKVLEKTKMVFTITDKLTGQTSGYALMLSDSFVSPDLIQLLPWQASHSHGDIQPDREGESVSRGLTPGSLASDLYISEDSSVNSTVEDELSLSIQEISDVSSGSRVKTNNDVREATEVDVDDDAKFRAYYNNPPIFNTGTSHKSSLAQTFAAEISSKLAAEKRAVSRNVCQSFMDEDSFGSTKSSRESAIKQTYEQSVPGKSSQGIQSKYAAFFTDVGVTQPDNRKGKLVKCLLCEKEIGSKHYGRHLRAVHKSSVECGYDQSVSGKYPTGNQSQSRYAAFFTDVGVTQPENDRKGKLVRCLLCKKEIGSSHFGRHIRLIHELSVECDICGGEFSPQRINVHKKICIASSFKSPEIKVKEPRSSINLSKSENREVKAKFQEIRAQESRLSENKLKSANDVKVMFRKMKAQELKLENEEVKIKLISALRPEIGVKVALKRNVKIKKAMKIFAEKYNANRKKLSFGIGGVKLTGDELVSELEGREIIVHGKVNLT